MIPNLSFPRLRAQTQGSQGGEIDDWLYAIDYHLTGSIAAMSECSQTLRTFEIHWNTERQSIQIANHSFFDVVRHGDVAIREGISALECALMLVNNASGHAVTPKNVAWGPSGRGMTFRTKLAQKLGADFGRLEKTLDDMYQSQAQASLRGYRDWVTHRGAPHVHISDSINSPVEVEGELLANLQTAAENHAIDQRTLSRVESALYQVISDNIEIICWPFVPPVSAVFSGHFDVVETDMSPIPGILIGAGCRDITIRDAKHSIGPLSMPKADYSHHNRTDVSKRSKTVAGELLATYAVRDYVHAVDSTVAWIADALTSDLDIALSEITIRL